jgi:predicted dehydrogenase
LKPVKFGIVGLGYIGQIHLRHCLKLPEANVAAVADISEKALKKAKKAGAKKTYTNYEDLINDPEVEAVIVALPTHLHLQCARKVAEAGKNIFLEKPMALTVDEAKEIIFSAQKNSVKLMMGYPLRFNKSFIDAKNKMETGELGEIENAHATYISSGPFFHRADGTSPVPVPDWWFNQKLTGGGVFADLGSHIINLLRWYFGEVTDIKSYFGHRFNLDFEDSAMCLAKFESKTVALINVGWFSQKYALTLDFLGSVGHLHAEHSPPSPVVTAAQMLLKGKTEFYQPHVDEIIHFIECINNDLAPSPSGLDGLRDLEAIAKAYMNRIELS